MYTATVNELITWVDNERINRGWSMRELARRADLSKSYVHLVLSGQRGAGTDFCKGIAKAFGVQEEEVFRMAGLLSPIPNPEDKSLREIIEIVQSMTPDERKQVARWLLGFKLSAPPAPQPGQKRQQKRAAGKE